MNLNNTLNKLDQYAPDQMPGFNLETYKQSPEYKKALEENAFLDSPEYLKYSAEAGEYNRKANIFMDSQTSSLPKEVSRKEKIKKVIDNCKNKADKDIDNCVKYGYLSSYAGSDGIPVGEVYNYIVLRPDKIIDMAIIKKVIQNYNRERQKQIENGVIFEDLKNHRYNPQTQGEKLISKQLRTKPTSPMAFKKISKRKSKRVSAKRSKKRSKRKSKRVSAKRSKKRSKRKSKMVSQNRSKKRSKRKSKKLSAKRSK